jgi:hypothetical protein
MKNQRTSGSHIVEHNLLEKEEKIELSIDQSLDLRETLNLEEFEQLGKFPTSSIDSEKLMEELK